eukprot:jgi/Hompol1/1073/HPOL_001177-RA
MRPVTLLWPLHRIAAGDSCTRDLLRAAHSPAERLALAPAWLLPSEMDPLSLASLTSQQPSQSQEPSQQPPILDPNGRQDTQHLPDRRRLPHKSQYLVYSPAYAQHLFKSSLDGSRFAVTNDITKVDIVWMTKFDRSKLRDDQFCSDYPNQTALVIKDLLQKAIYRRWGIEGAKSWYPRSFNLNTETCDFVSAFLNGQNEDPEHNVWIVKPWNGTRSQGMTVSRHLPEILKQLATGPKLVCKSLLDGKHKFDLRVLVVIDSVAPLRMFAVPSVIYAREANVEYDKDLQMTDSFEHHFTVMGYRQLDVKKTPLGTLAKRIEACFAHKQLSFDKDILPRILKVIRKGIEAGAYGSEGIQHDPQARMLVGADVLLDAEANPWLLEFTAGPDTGRIIDVWPSVYGDLFESLFAAEQLSERFVPF